MSGRSKEKFKAGEGDWICPDESCGNVNFSKRTTCNRCDKERSDGGDVKKGGQEIGKALAEKSKGLFSADDWQCKTCGNVNWARRMSCNMCNSPKFGKIEARTGYGGGYMEREQNVDYKPREESDDEFDEYGRKKKKYRGQIPEITPIKRKAEVEEKEDASKYQLESEEDDDDDDDDEDVDLSKYALDDSDDEEDDKKLSKSSSDDKTKNGSHSRSSRSYSSRSRSSSSSSSSSRSRSRSRSSSQRKRRHSRSRSRSSSYDSRKRRRNSRRSNSGSSYSSRSRSRSHSKNHHRRSRSRS